MPHLQFEINQKVSNETKEKFINEVIAEFSKIMDTGTYHIAVSVREYDKYSLAIGRSSFEDNICLMNLDIRQGRTIEQRRTLVLKYMQLIESYFNVETKNQYATISEHKGEDFHLVEKYLASWQSGEEPLD